MDKISQLFPEGYSETRISDKSIHLSKADIPWLVESGKEVKLISVILENGVKFYLGSAITHKTLVDEAEKIVDLGEKAQHGANSGFYRTIRSFVDAQSSPDVPKLQHPRTSKAIYYGKEASGIRTYFMQFGTIDDKPVIIRLAACTKNGQAKVLNIIATG